MAWGKGGSGQVYVCVVPLREGTGPAAICWSGPWPQQRCWCCWVPRCAQQPSSAHGSAAKAEAELFGARRGDSAEAAFTLPTNEAWV